MESSRTSDICNVVVHRASNAKCLRGKKHTENMIQNETIISEWLFEEEHTPIKNKIKKIYNPTTLQQLARENIKLGDKGLDKELAKRMINPKYFTDENLKIGFKISVEIHNNNHANFLLNIFPFFYIWELKQDILLKS